MTATIMLAGGSADMNVPMASAPSQDDGWFAIARVNGTVRLIQVSSATPASALTTLDVKIFRHEFIHIFRFLESRTLHPADIHILERIAPSAACPDGDTVSLAKDVLARMSRLTAPSYGHARYPSVGARYPARAAGGGAGTSMMPAVRHPVYTYAHPARPHPAPATAAPLV